MRMIVALILFSLHAQAVLPPLSEMEPAPVLRISRVGAHLVFARCRFTHKACEHLNRVNTEQIMRLREQLENLSHDKLPRTGIPEHRQPEIEHKANVFATYSTLALASMTTLGYSINARIGPVFTFGTLAAIFAVLGSQVWTETQSMRLEQREAYRTLMLTTFDDAFSQLRALAPGQTEFVALPSWFWRELNESLHNVSK